MTRFWATPLRSVTNSTKLSSSVEPIGRTFNVAAIFNRWAPLAAKFEVPEALSKRVESFSGVIIDSEISNPTLPSPNRVYFESTL